MQAHVCRPPRSWEAGAWLVVGFAVLFAAAAIVLATATRPHLVPRDPALIGSGLGMLAALIGIIVSQRVWNWSTRRIAEAHGIDGTLMTRHWYLRALAGLTVISILLRTLLDSSAAMTGCVAGALLVVAGVLSGRARTRALIAGFAPVPAQAPAS